MIIDTHTHIGLDRETIRATSGELVKSMDAAGIDRALVFGGAINDCPNSWLLDQVDHFPDRLSAVASVSPLRSDAPTPKAVDRLAAKGRIAGLKLYPGYEHYYPADAVIRPYLKIAADRGLPVVFHSGDLFNKIPGAKLKYAQAIHIDDLAVELPNLKIVIAHLGYPWMVDAAQVCQKNANVYADISGLVYGRFTSSTEAQIVTYLRQFVAVCESPEKVLFGTDWPIADQSDYVVAMPCIVSAVFGETAVPGVMGGNALRVFGLHP